MAIIEESTRQQKVGRLIQKELSSIFQKECSDYVTGVIATVTKVRVSPDLSYAKVYMSIFPFNKNEELMQRFTSGKKHIRLYLGKRVKSQLRIVPELSFYLDDSMEYIENIETLLKED